MYLEKAAGNGCLFLCSTNPFPSQLELKYTILEPSFPKNQNFGPLSPFPSNDIVYPSNKDCFQRYKKQKSVVPSAKQSQQTVTSTAFNSSKTIQPQNGRMEETDAENMDKGI